MPGGGAIPSNIAEGHGCLSDKSFAVFLGQARGSLFELETQLELAGSLGYLKEERIQPLLAQCEQITRMLNALQKTLRQDQSLIRMPSHANVLFRYPLYHLPGLQLPASPATRLLAVRVS